MSISKCEFCKKEIMGKPILNIGLYGCIIFCSDKHKSDFYLERINRGLCPTCNIGLKDGICPICGYDYEGMRSLEGHLSEH